MQYVLAICGAQTNNLSVLLKQEKRLFTDLFIKHFPSVFNPEKGVMFVTKNLLRVVQSDYYKVYKG